MSAFGLATPKSGGRGRRGFPFPAFIRSDHYCLRLVGAHGEEEEKPFIILTSITSSMSREIVAWRRNRQNTALAKASPSSSTKLGAGWWWRWPIFVNTLVFFPPPRNSHQSGAKKARSHACVSLLFLPTRSRRDEPACSCRRLMTGIHVRVYGSFKEMHSAPLVSTL